MLMERTIEEAGKRIACALRSRTRREPHSVQTQLTTHPANPAQPVSPPGAAFWARWVLANAVAETLGLGASLLFGFYSMPSLEPQLGILLVAAIGVLGSTLIEGTAVGVAQWRVLRPALPRLTLRSWWLSTSVGALVAWTLGMLPSTIMGVQQEAGQAAVQEPSRALMLLLAALLGVVAGPVLATAQWWVLRRHVERAWWWIPANSAAWAVGMVIIFAAMDLVTAETTAAQIAPILLAALFIAGAAVGAVHGAVLVWLLRRRG